jgi:hypothetical protein
MVVMMRDNRDMTPEQPAELTAGQAAARQAARETVKFAFMVAGVAAIALLERIMSRPDAAREIRMRAAQTGQAWGHAAAELAHGLGGMLHTAALRANLAYRRDTSDG